MSLPPRTSAARTRVTLVTGGSGAAREAAIAARLHAAATRSGAGSSAVLLEGLPDGHSLLTPSDSVSIQRIAPACLCCTGNLVLRVTLNRILRFHPESLYIGVATSDHLDQLRSWLQSAPYDQLLELTPDVQS
ncbi:MAG: GTPase [Gammaproteobacteria bacterium]